MKKIIMCVPDDQVGAILGLVADMATELHVTVAEDTQQPKGRGRTRKTVNASPPQNTRMGKMVLAVFSSPDREVTSDEIAAVLKNGGYAASSLSAITSQLVKAGCIERAGEGTYRRAPRAAD